ncbi:MAG: pyruvate, phosphate dikinase, partial [Pseudomonadota bacterium]
MNSWIYHFRCGQADGDASMRELLGGKGAGLAEMCRIGLPVPPGFTITTEACTHYYAHDESWPDTLEAQIHDAITKVETTTGRSFGSPDRPLLVSVRSGARASMPGMMDTVLNLGLNDATVEGLARSSGDSRFAFDSYRRFIQMYANVVLGVSHDLFEHALEEAKLRADIVNDTDLDVDQLRLLVQDYKQLIEQETARELPQDVHAQLSGAINAVFKSWMTPRAVTYRRIHELPESWGTAVNVQAMVFGNLGEDCATGVAFTRDPSTGENRLYGEYLLNAQGEDVVAGIRTPGTLTNYASEIQHSALPSMEQAMPDLFSKLCEVRALLEQHYQDMQDIEFTVEKGTLYLLQTRTGKRTTRAALKIASDMVRESLITSDEAIMRIAPETLDQVLHPLLDPNATHTVLAQGLPASPGAATGKLAFSADEAEHMASMGDAVILVRTETSPEDIHGMHAARGILTTRGGMTSHAAVVARGMGRPCITGAKGILIEEQLQMMRIGNQSFHQGEWITIDGNRGHVIAGQIKTVSPEPGEDFETIMGWADQRRNLKVRANSETVADTKTALAFGAEGIGLCRTEHMFFDADRITTMREMILAEDEAGRRQALSRILPMQRSDFVGLFQLMAGKPVTIRLLDPPLHEFLPRTEREFEDLAKAIGVSVGRIERRARSMAESNPMLGHRGCRLLNSYPEICEMQARAIFEAAAELKSQCREACIIEVMIPLVAMPKELELLAVIIRRVADEVQASAGITIDYQIGTMIELPRAALRAGEIAHHAQFFSFGTNDLTQTAFGLSRDDSAGFLGNYERRGIIEHDPFARLDLDGVGELITIAAERGRATRPDIKLGICGEHGGDPQSIHFCADAGLDYVSCSPFRVPIAR